MTFFYYPVFFFFPGFVFNGIFNLFTQSITAQYQTILNISLRINNNLAKQPSYCFLVFLTRAVLCFTPVLQPRYIQPVGFSNLASIRQVTAPSVIAQSFNAPGRNGCIFIFRPNGVKMHV